MIYVIRHGQTDLNSERRMQGRLGLALNEVGIKQAELLREKLQDIEFDVIISSPQERAVQTAEIATGKRAIKEARIDVFDLGEADRLKVTEVKMSGNIPDANVYRGVENPDKFIKRVFSYMNELESEYGDNNLNILISGHRCTTGCVGAYFEGIPNDENILRYSSDNGDYKKYAFK